jgi:hypothetical protein
MLHITRAEAVMDAIHQAWDMAHVRDSDTARPTPPRVDSGEFIERR